MPEGSLSAAPNTTTRSWTPVCGFADLAARGRRLVKVDGKQIALFHRPDRGATAVFACNNRCPHEGYPLIDGSLGAGEDAARPCVLTCNWHNWKFDLTSGDTLTGGDALRLYPARVTGDRVELDLTDPPAAARIPGLLAGLRAAMQRRDEPRMARELARLAAVGADPLDGLRDALAATADRYEFGTTHAIAAAPDWLALRDRAETPETSLMPLVEVIHHIAWDTLRQPAFPYPDISAAAAAAYDADALVAAIEAEDEAAALAQVAAALAAGADYAALRPALARAALAHYQDFGHAAIHVVKTGELADRLGAASLPALLRPLVRALVTATREDLIPEFRGYGRVRRQWPAEGGDAPIVAADLAGLAVDAVLARLLASARRPAAEVYDAVLGAAARAMLQFDLAHQDRIAQPVSQNVGWLDFTHMVTFANAGRHLATAEPALWPDVLLQAGCFLGRAVQHVDRSIDPAPWAVADPLHLIDSRLVALFDHRYPEPIVSAHAVKTLTAARQEIAARPDAPWAADLGAAMHRLLNTPLRRKFTLRNAHQALAFVRAAG